MAHEDATTSTSPTRRSVVAGAATLAAGAASGCVQRTRSILGRGSTSQVSLTIKTVPGDADRAATTIARRLGDNLEAAGVDADVVLESEDELRRSLLLSNDFDVYVTQYPGYDDPDFLRPLLHSVFGEEPGWQNPFGYVNISLDDRLEEQRRLDGTARRSVIADALRTISEEHPFEVVAFPDEVRAVRTDRFEGWRAPGLGSPLGYLSLSPSDGSEGPVDRLRVTATDERATRNLNPIAVEYRDRGTFTGLLYEPLARHYAGGVLPWLAGEWTWGDEEATTAMVRLREGLEWHDGRPLTAADVAFTYEFLDDTSLGEGATAVPAPRFRGPVTLIEAVEAEDDRTLRFSFGETSPEVAVHAFAVPILPEHVWRPHAVPADIAGLDLFEGVTEALVWDNPDPVGSGALRFERSIPDEAIVFSRFDGHFLHRGDAPERWAGGGVAFDGLTVRVAPSDTASIELVAIGEADATATPVDATVVPRIGRNERLTLVVTASRSFYHVGFNARREPLVNPRFRGVVAKLLDKRSIVDTVFEGYATPSGSPLGESRWTPSDLRWIEGTLSTSVFDSNGELDADAARDLFREIGYRYDGENRLLGR